VGCLLFPFFRRFYPSSLKTSLLSTCGPFSSPRARGLSSSHFFFVDLVANTRRRATPFSCFSAFFLRYSCKQLFTELACAHGSVFDAPSRPDFGPASSCVTALFPALLWVFVWSLRGVSLFSPPFIPFLRSQTGCSHFVIDALRY